MKTRPSLQMAYVRLTSCSGCQLMLMNCEKQLATLASQIVLLECPIISSLEEFPKTIDLVLVEGSVSTPGDLTRLIALRRRAKLMAAVGSCALNGGINSLIKEDRGDAIESVYQRLPATMESFPPKPLHDFVSIDWRIPGCPPERKDLIEVLGTIQHFGWPGWQEMPVCMECRVMENRCLLVDGKQPCLGPVTQAGCGARCPGQGVVCEGCRGAVIEANWDEMFRLMLETGLAEREARSRLDRFRGGSHA